MKSSPIATLFKRAREELRCKLIQYLSQQKSDRGFTLIELLVVIIITGVLSATALPAFLSQVGKARETELKNIVGTVNRTQQAYHFEKQTFADNPTSLGLNVNSKYITNMNMMANADNATVAPENTNAIKDATRAYAGRVDFNAGIYELIVCQSDSSAINLTPPSSASACSTGTKIQ